MPNLADALKAEIARIARKEVRAETSQIKTASATYRHQIASLRKQMDALERQLKKATKSQAKVAAPAERDEAGRKLRFSATRFAGQRQKLGLSAADMAKLIGVSPLSVYAWEKGQSRPRAKQLEAISQVRGIGKRAAAARLESLSEKA